MPDRTPPPRGPRPSRRQVLVGAAGAAGAQALLAGCGLHLESSGDRTPGEAPGADETARERAAVDADALAALAAQVHRLRPDLRRALGPVAADHREHARALRRGAVTATTAATTAAAAPTATPVPPPPATATAAGQGQVTRANGLGLLVDLERRSATSALDALDRVSGPVARLLASVSASRSVHVATLARLPSPPRPAS